MIRTNTLCWLIPLLLIVTFPLWKIPVGDFLAPPGGIDSSMTKEENEQISQNFSMENSVIKKFENDKLVSVVRSSTAKTGETSDQFHLTDVKADLFDEEQNLTHVVAKTGDYNSNTELLLLKKNVVVDRKQEGQKLFTEELLYDGKKQLITSPVHTKIVTKDAKIEGGTFNYDIQAGRYDFDKRVNVILSGPSPI